jgi:hypothetical protein
MIGKSIIRCIISASYANPFPLINVCRSDILPSTHAKINFYLMEKSMVCIRSSRYGGCALALLLSAAISILFAMPLQGAEQTQSSPGFSLRRPSHLLIGVHMGVDIPQAKGDLFGLLTNILSLNKSDLRAPVFGFDVGVPFHPSFSAVGNIDYSRFSRDSEFRHFANNGKPITQTTRLSQFSFVGTLRYYPRKTWESVGSYAWIPTRIMPYVAAGGGLIHYNLSQHGSFVDQSTLNIFPGRYLSAASSFVKHCAAGLDFSLSLRIVVNLEARYSWAGAGISAGTDGINPDFHFTNSPAVDLGGLKLAGGAYLRY